MSPGEMTSRHVQLGGLGPAQAPPVDGLEDGRVAIGGKCPLALGPHRPIDLLVGVVEELLKLVAGERPGLRTALVVAQVRDGVPLVADRNRIGAERVLASRYPAI